MTPKGKMYEDAGFPNRHKTNIKYTVTTTKK